MFDVLPSDMMLRLPSLLGVAFVFVCLYALSYRRKAISWMLVGKTALVHIVLALMMLHWSWGAYAVEALASGVSALYRAADAGSSFLFGALAQPAAGSWGFVFAFRVLPIIVFFGAFMALLSYFGVVQLIVSGIRKVAQPFWGTGGAETTCAIANSFLGQTEAPLLIKQYLESMSPSSIFVVMVAGMGTIQAPLMAVYGAMGVPLKHILAASIMAVPATLMCAKMVYPLDDAQEKLAQRDVVIESGPSSWTEAIARGTTDGLMLALNVGAMLIAFIALISLLNMALGSLSGRVNGALSCAGFSWMIPTLSLEKILGYVFAPLGWLLGFSGQQAMKLGELVGIKIAANEMIAYSELVTSALSERGVILATYALCGFSNFSSIGIQVGGIGILAPNQRSLLAKLGMRAVFVAALANVYSAFVVNLIL